MSKKKSSVRSTKKDVDNSFVQRRDVPRTVLESFSAGSPSMNRMKEDFDNYTLIHGYPAGFPGPR
jgi:hypothetical protein